jgi:CDP-diacylglycerol--glycerol-3-phosphate 3-phosphatidyltransferase
VTLYELKPRFQSLLRPMVATIARLGVTANQVTLAAALLSVGIGAFVAARADTPAVFVLLPAWLFVRMAFNAIDGMLAREFGQQTRLGAYLNELTDVVSDAALYLPFAFVAPFSAHWVWAVIALAGLSEFAGALGQGLGGTRRYDGPMGKSDRAFVFGALGTWVAVAAPLPALAAWVMPVIAALLAWTVFNRVRRGLQPAA